MSYLGIPKKKGNILTKGEFRTDTFASVIYDYCEDAEPYAEHMLLINVLARALLDLTYRPDGEAKTFSTKRRWFGYEKDRKSAENYFAARRHEYLCALIRIDIDQVDRWVRKLRAWQIGDDLSWLKAA